MNRTNRSTILSTLYISHTYNSIWFSESRRQRLAHIVNCPHFRIRCSYQWVDILEVLVNNNLFLCHSATTYLGLWWHWFGFTSPFDRLVKAGHGHCKQESKLAMMDGDGAKAQLTYTNNFQITKTIRIKHKKDKMTPTKSSGGVW